MHFNKSRKMSVIALTRKQKIGKTEGWHHNVHPMMAKILRIGLELFACGQGIWRQMFDRSRLLIGSCFWKITTPPPLHPPICHMCDSFDAEANKWERRKYDTYKWVKQKQTNKKKTKTFCMQLYCTCKWFHLILICFQKCRWSVHNSTLQQNTHWASAKAEQH